MSDAVEQLAPTAVEGDEIAFRLADPGHDRSGVRLWCDLDLGPHLELGPVPGGWELRLPLPDVACLEYMFEVPGHPDPGLERDPGNPHRVDGPFGAHSWLALPGYEPPGWLDTRRVTGGRRAVTVDRTPAGSVEAVVWSPEDTHEGDRLPLLVAHDGPEMDAYGGLTHYVGAMVEAGRLPPMRVALLLPGPRNRRYAANPAYATALTAHVMPALLAACPTDRPPVLTGQSLGGLAALHAAWTSPGTFGGLFLQSGSFFTPELDPQEKGFEYWRQVTGFVASLLAASTAAPRAPVTTLTCGTAEENLANNRLMARHLAATGVDVSWGETAQGHTWTCWRDLLDPHLTDLLTHVWSR